MGNEACAEKTGWWRSFLSSEFFFHCEYNIPAIVDSTLVLITILTIAVGRFLAPQNPYDPTQIGLSDFYLSPFWLDGKKMSFLLGTDEQGRGILSAIIYGSTSSIMIGLTGMATSCCIGTTLGLIAGYSGGRVDAVITRTANIQLSFPFMLVALFIVSVFGRGVGKLLIALIMVGWMIYARTVQGETLFVKKMEYVEATRTIGFPGRITIIRYMLPSVVNSITILVTTQIGNFILTKVISSSFGVGVPVTQPSLGLLVKTGFDVLFSGLWRASVFPSLYIMLIVFGISLLGDFLKDELNPNLK